MNIKRIIAATAAVMLLMLTACGSNDSKKVADPAKTADDMVAVFAPQGELLLVEDSVMDNFYTIDPAVVSASRVYVSSSFIAEEVAVFAVKEGKEADAKKMVEQRIQDLKDSFDGYLPEEFAAMDNAKVLSGGGLVCLLTGTGDGVAAAEAEFVKATK